MVSGNQLRQLNTCFDSIDTNKVLYLRNVKYCTIIFVSIIHHYGNHGNVRTELVELPLSSQSTTILVMVTHIYALVFFSLGPE